MALGRVAAAGAQRPTCQRADRDRLEPKCLHRRQAAACDRRRRQAGRARLSRSRQSARADHGAIQRRHVGAPGLLGREQDRLGHGQFGQPVADGPAAGGWTLGAAGSRCRGGGPARRELWWAGWHARNSAGTCFGTSSASSRRTPQGASLYDRQETWELAETSRDKSPVPEAVRAAIKVEPAKRSEQQRQAVRDYFVRIAYNKTRAVFDPLNREADQIAKAEADLKKAFSATMVMQELPQPRETFVLVRGDFRSKGDKVSPGVPASLSPLPAGAPANRLGLARWLVDPNNPLVGRVTVNRYWQQYFGTGLVKTSEDFGSQGEWPSHPELLDWLASEFVGSGWDVKALQKLIVMSAAYRQSSHVDARSAQARSVQPAAGARPAVSARRRNDSRQRAGGQRLARRPLGRTERFSLSAGRFVGRGRLWPRLHGRKATCKATASISIVAEFTPTGSGPCPIRRW